MKNSFLLLIGIGLFTFGSLKAQSVLEYYEKPPTAEDDNIYVKHHYDNNRVVPYAYLREADVMWQKRYWRVIDLREKMNHPLYYPIYPIKDRKSMWEVIRNAVVTEGSVAAYGDDEFRTQITPEEIAGKISSIDTVTSWDIDTGEEFIRIDTVTMDNKDVLQYIIKEDWFFDKQRSVMEVRILGICPVGYIENTETGNKEPQKLFWIWFPEVREHLAHGEVFNPSNDSERRTFDEILHLRKFASYITKESNVYDREIFDYKKFMAMEQILEAENIKESIRNFEHDLWEY